MRDARMERASTGRVFICYRRGRTSYPAALLYDRLSVDFGKSQIFKDVDNIRPGDDFIDKITRAVGACDALLAVIGPDWLTASDERGKRLDDPTDFVRLEIETALNRGILVIPVLVEDARMPRPEQLPEPLRPLARRQAHEVSAAHTRRDTDELVSVLRSALEGYTGRLLTGDLTSAPGGARAMVQAAPSPAAAPGQASAANAAAGRGH